MVVKYELKLPADLPPSFKGKSFKFSYNVSVGTNRIQLTGNTGSGGGTQVSRVLKVPVRIYNHVAGESIILDASLPSSCLTYGIESNGSKTIL
jgi:hypothetical protein